MEINVITLVLSSLLLVSVICLAVLTAKQARKISELGLQLKKTEQKLEKAGEESVALMKEELSKQRILLTQSLSDINNNVTRSVINRNRTDREE